MILQAVSAAKDQPSYQQAIQWLGSQGMDVSSLPPQYDPAFVANSGRQAMTIVQRADQEWKAKGYDLDVQKFGETQRENRAREGLTARGQNMADARAREGLALQREAQARKAADEGKPLPPGALKMQQEALDAIGVSSSINADLSKLEEQVNTGKLKFGPVANLTSTGLNMAGMSTENSRNFATFKSSLERLRNESLRLNAGVQTDGDAQRAWNELFSSINDTDLVKQRLKEIQAINKRGVELQKLKVDSVRANYGKQPIETSQFEAVKPALGDAARPTSAPVARPAGSPAVKAPSVSNW
jgi:hypothetical protein